MSLCLSLIFIHSLVADLWTLCMLERHIFGVIPFSQLEKQLTERCLEGRVQNIIFLFLTQKKHQSLKKRRQLTIQNNNVTYCRLFCCGASAHLLFETSWSLRPPSSSGWLSHSSKRFEQQVGETPLITERVCLTWPHYGRRPKHDGPIHYSSWKRRLYWSFSFGWSF